MRFALLLGVALIFGCGSMSYDEAIRQYDAAKRDFDTAHKQWKKEDDTLTSMARKRFKESSELPDSAEGRKEIVLASIENPEQKHKFGRFCDMVEELRQIAEAKKQAMDEANRVMISLRPSESK